MDEFALIRRFFRDRPGQPADGVLLGPGDDAALLLPTPGHELVMTLDTLLSGRHFPDDLPAADIGWRSLAVNLSDLAAMGATPRWCLLSLSLPDELDAGRREHWLSAFCEGFYALAAASGVVLVGGDMVRGPLSISVQATGEVPAGQALRRSGARPGDSIWIGGVPGEAAAGLAAWFAGVRDGALVQRFSRPTPQLALGQALRGRATACIDVSDGLLADLGHILSESGAAADLGAMLRLADLPCSTALAGTGDARARQQWQLAGGDDYLLLFTLPPGQEPPAAMAAHCHRIGAVTSQAPIQVLDPQGCPLLALPQGWNHFATRG
ncbi:thiamine-phosphate kinase [Alcanivorax sp. JB21]|uniref:thiamine-phosphate kinase n=1 Tax=Alcanivorax limicola TaxID=2874102 RepID=UPI001CC03AE3|nr:thiamine-phosphate kinase [Alcanivorax limicola]MBZ2190204.1 thiamine-phosphate kinase [Alcanivorax limicola]